MLPGWSYGIAEHFTKHGLLFCVDAHRHGKRFIVEVDDLLTAFLSLERDAIASKGAKGNATRQNIAYSPLCDSVGHMLSASNARGMFSYPLNSRGIGPRKSDMHFSVILVCRFRNAAMTREVAGMLSRTNAHLAALRRIS